MRATTGTGARRIASHTSWIEVMKGRDHVPDVRAADEGAVAVASKHDGPKVGIRGDPRDGRGEGVGVVLRDDVELPFVFVADGRHPSAVGVVVQIDVDVAHVVPPGLQPNGRVPRGPAPLEWTVENAARPPAGRTGPNVS